MRKRQLQKIQGKRDVGKLELQEVQLKIRKKKAIIEASKGVDGERR